MGRHSAPTDRPTGPSGRLVGLGVAVLAAAAVLAVVLVVALRGGDDGTLTADPGAASSTGTPSGPATRSPSTTPSASPSSAASSSTTVTASASSTPAPTRTNRPPTLDLQFSGTSYLTVRDVHGRTLVSEMLHRGAHRVFDQTYVRAVIGNAGVVRVTVNGHRLAPGRSGAVRTVVARRR